ncbi:MAG: hypothetical protein LBD20_08980 [Spirochaetaceae bacterium]|jgi:hypothetical protein|nr:hypothetical protein [Spirochaetaceae bacterium]
MRQERKTKTGLKRRAIKKIHQSAGSIKTGSVFVLLLVLSIEAVYAKGKTETKAAVPINTTWTLVITEADVSALPAARMSIGDVWDRNLYQSVRYIQFRMRENLETEYYTNAEWLKAQTTAAKAIKTKQAERDALYFKGPLNWRYKQQIKKIDVDIKKLYETFAEAEKTKPLIEKLPAFSVKDPDSNGAFPKPPKTGGDVIFCAGQKADAFITSTISLYHERIYIEIKLWSLYTKSYTYTDSVIFSMEDMNEASMEICARFVDEMTGVLPTAVRIKASPEEAVIVVGDNFAGQGESGLISRSPGEVEITAFSPKHETITTKVELTEGDLTGITLNLTPVPDLEFGVDTRNSEEASVYSGALFAGKTPLTLSDSAEKNMNISAITKDGRSAGALFKISEKPVELNPKMPPKKGRVEKARKGFYGAWGRFWIVLPLTWLAVGISDAYINSFNTSGGERTEVQFNTANYIYWTAGAAGILAGIFLVESLGRFIWYGYQADRPTTPLDP